MSAFEQLSESISTQKERLSRVVRDVLFGVNNERLDFIMDSFYKLSPTHRNGVLAGLIGSVVLLVGSIVWLYFHQVHMLRKELNDGFKALHELQVRRGEYDREKKRFDRLVSQVSNKTRRLNFKPLFERLANQQKARLEGLGEQNIPIAVEDPLSEKLRRVKVDVTFPEISVPRLLNLLSEIEKANDYLAVEDLEVRSRFGTKLFFSANVKVRGFKAK